MGCGGSDKRERRVKFAIGRVVLEAVKGRGKPSEPDEAADTSKPNEPVEPGEPGELG